MLVELGLVEQRFKAVLEVLEQAASVTDVARRYGVGRQSVHRWLRLYSEEGLSGLADRSHRPWLVPHSRGKLVTPLPHGVLHVFRDRVVWKGSRRHPELTFDKSE